MKFFDRLVTILITATITSAFWIIFGNSIASMAEQQDETVESAPVLEPALPPDPAQTAPAPSAPVQPAPETGTPAALPSTVPTDAPPVAPAPIPAPIPNAGPAPVPDLAPAPLATPAG